MNCAPAVNSTPVAGRVKSSGPAPSSEDGTVARVWAGSACPDAGCPDASDADPEQALSTPSAAASMAARTAGIRTRRYRADVRPSALTPLPPEAPGIDVI